MFVKLGRVLTWGFCGPSLAHQVAPPWGMKASSQNLSCLSMVFSQPFAISRANWLKIW
jgi:hypothetical protein